MKCQLESAEEEIKMLKELIVEIQKGTGSIVASESWADLVRDSFNNLTTNNPTLPNNEHQDISPQQHKQVSSEMEDIDKKKLNLIISGLPERDEDANDLIEYVKTNCDIWLQQDNILKTERLGRPLGQMRLLISLTQN